MIIVNPVINYVMQFLLNEKKTDLFEKIIKELFYGLGSLFSQSDLRSVNDPFSFY